MINNGKKIFIWFLVFVFILVSLLLSRIFKELQVVQDMRKFMLYSGFIGFFMITYIPFAYTAIMEAQNIKKTEPYKVASLGAAFAMIVLIFLFPVAITTKMLSKETDVESANF